jgi:transglutaminase-like putative cysteine protease
MPPPSQAPVPAPARAAPSIAQRLSPRLSSGLSRDKSDTLLLLAAALMVLAPHFEHLPLWIGAVVCATLLWRAFITWRGKRMPPLWLLLPVSVASMAGVYRSYHTLLGRDAGVAMLALLLAFKLLEMRARRDLFVVVFLSFFVLLTNFFYSQSMPTALFMVATLIVLLTAQQSFQYTGAVPPLAKRLRTSAKVFLLAAPLALLMFVGFPRIQGPLWGLPGDAHTGHTGISDSMAPGTLSSLAQSEETAFRVRFLDPVPAQNQLYWRSIVLGDYDGRTWTRVPRKRGLERLDVAIAARGKAVRHEVTMEPTGKRWLALLELTGPDLRLPGLRLRDSDELEQFSADPVNQRVRYSASAWLDVSVQAGERPERMTRWLELPAGFNPRTLALARQLREATPAADSPAERAQHLAQAVLTRFHNESYSYTLQPPLLGRDAVDEFLFDSKAGFCEHYAGAFVVLMRAAGVPARVVTGYQGGELNPLDGYLTVRQSDAHAWAEIWSPGVGWRRVDPTGAVAPERIVHNLARALPPPSTFGLGPLMALQNDPNSWLAQLRFRYGAMNNAWNQWVLDYNPERQRSFLEELARFASALANWRGALGAALVFALVAALRWQRRARPGDPLERLYQAFCARQARHGYARRLEEGPRSYAERLRGMPASQEKHAAIEKFLTLYGALKYGAAGPDARSASLTTLKTLLPLCR